MLSKIGKKNNKSIAQVIQRWLIHRNVIAIPKSVHKERIEQNFRVFDISNEDMHSIAALDTGPTLLFYHRNPKMIKWLSVTKLDI
ncbi:hypothetical protein GCM10007049_08430 [Echinicola pacifica]|uniref:NADP-dependent oxidoreductase domain-containing protein n=1 Tax=Echinicola pacifica TaxID=346377 RepID=A0A918PQS7_9BACT|nr:aldo/keto reductase [Echinicola pacifica]GGZ18534.1 hypothetical protein GCM10007049_08430 [Echinicola pacifica]